MNALFLTSMAAVSTSVGGCCAVLLQRRVRFLMAFGTGVLVGAACLDLLPSALSAAATKGVSRACVFLTVGAGALLVFCVKQITNRRSSNDQNSRAAGRIGACLLIVHSTLDGAAIFAASAISIEMGLIVGLGVVAHDICDGLNTILLSTGGRIPEWKDYVFLAIDALAPISGGLIAAHAFSVSPALAMVFLGLAAGSFLYTAVFGLFPDACRCGRRYALPWIALGGFFVVWLLSRLLGVLA